LVCGIDKKPKRLIVDPPATGGIRGEVNRREVESLALRHYEAAGQFSPQPAQHQAREDDL